MKNEQQTITPILGIYQLFSRKLHRGTKGTKFLEALLASKFTLERSAVCSDPNLCIHVSARGSATLYAAAPSSGCLLVSGLGHAQPQVPPMAKGSVGTRHVARVLRPPLQRSAKFGLWYCHGPEWLQQGQQQMHLVLRRGLVLRLPDSACTTVGRFIWGAKGQEKS